MGAVVHNGVVHGGCEPMHTLEHGGGHPLVIIIEPIRFIYRVVSLCVVSKLVCELPVLVCLTPFMFEPLWSVSLLIGHVLELFELLYPLLSLSMFLFELLGCVFV